MAVYRISNQIINIADNFVCTQMWTLFEMSVAVCDNLFITVTSRFSTQYGIEILEPQPGSAVLKSGNTLLSASEDWTNIVINLLDGKNDGVESLIIASIMTHLSTRGGMMVHSSLVDCGGRGILFIGPSGIGKTTQAELWQKYRNAVIINGDMALLREEDGKFTGYGCPWHGSSPYCENSHVPICGIVVLEQALENTIEKLDGLPLVSRLMNNIFLPKWYEKGVEAVMETMDHLASEVPVHLLRCRPDEDAVSLVESVLWEKDDW